MSFSLLVLHGPNLARRAAEEIDPRLERRAEELDLELTIVQSNGEAGLLDALHAHADAVDGVVVNPGVLAPVAFALAEGLQLLGLPSVEVLLEAVPPTWGQSSLTSVVKLQLHGEGVEGYLKAVEHLSAGRPAASEAEAKPRRKAPTVATPSAPRGKTIGRKAAAAEEAPAPEASPSGPRGKTIGRASRDEKKAAPAAAAAPSGALTRTQVVERIKARLQGTETSEGLAAWARQQWTALQRGATVESGAKDVIENVLLTLMAGAKASDAVLVAQMAKLDA